MGLAHINHIAYSIVSIALVFTMHATACPALNQSQHVLYTADSLQAQGITYTDSTNIAHTVATLSKFRYFVPNDYAKANYYYGRLLREQGNPTQAMQCFINALHYNTKNKDLQGRVYTNIAIMCRLEGNHQLAYQMFEKSSEQFKQINDSIAYFYAVNSMAFELAEQSQIDECLSLLSYINQNCYNNDVLLKTLETKAEAYFMVQKYDSAICYVDILHNNGIDEPTGYLIKAQSYSYLNQKDSAVYYAFIVAKQSNSLFDLNNSLYIIANDNTETDINFIQQTHASRSDVQKQIEQRRSELSHAVELLEQELNKKNYHIGIILTIAILLIIISICVYIRIHSRQKQLRQEQAELKALNKQIVSSNEKLLQQQAKIQLQQNEHQQSQLLKIERLCEAVRNSNDIKKELHWADYDKMCTIMNTNFNFIANKLKATNTLNETEIKLCILVLINLRYNQIAEILPYALNSIGKLKDTTAKHLGTTGKLLRNRLLDMVIDKC